MPATTAPAPAPKPKPKPGGSGAGSGSTGTTTSKPPAKKPPATNASSAQQSSAAKKKSSGSSSASSVPAVGAAPGASTVSVPSLLPDPTPPSMRLRPGFAENLAAAAARSHVDWALMLGVIRAQGAQGAAPATGSTLDALASRLRAAGANSSPAAAARSILGAKPNASARAVALSNYYDAVGLTALVRGLDWAKPGLQQKILNDSRVNIYPGGRNDIAAGRINVRVLATVEYLAQTFQEVTISCLITGHRLYARPGVISAHVYGLAVDVAAVDNVNIIGHQGRGSITEKAIRDILMLPPEVQPNQVISLMALGGPSFALSDHWNHIHIGFAPIPYSVGLGEHDGFAVPPGADKNLLQLWQSAGQTYGVPWQVLAAINKIESNFGQNMGPSSAGAVGWMQFMPSTWARYGMDASGDGKADPYNAADAIYSAARYLAAAGAGTDLPRAIYSYNHADWYVDQVLQLASLFGNSSSSGLAFAGMGLPKFTLAAVTTPAAPERPNSLRDTALARGAVVEEDVAAPTTIGHGMVVDDAASAPTLPPESIVQQAKLEAGFSILRSLIVGGAAVPTASDKLASTTAALPSTAPTLASEPDGAFSLHAGYQLQTRAERTRAWARSAAYWVSEPTRAAAAGLASMQRSRRRSLRGLGRRPSQAARRSTRASVTRRFVRPSRSSTGTP